MLIWFSVLVVTCFERSLSNRRDSGFFVLGQLCRFIHKLCVRCLIDRCVPGIDDWNDLLSIHLESQEALLPADFLLRLNLTSKMDQALKNTAISQLSDKKLDRSRADALVEEMRDEFCSLARNYYLFLIEGVRKHVTMTTNNVKGMACSDPYVMSVMPLEFASRCFSELYRGFKLRGWLPDSSEQMYRDEYLAVLSHLRGTKTSLSSSPNVVHDVVDFMCNLPAVRERHHILHLFKLSCLCLTDKSSAMPVVKFGDVSTDNLSCRSIDVILPVQSFLATLPQSVLVCTSDSAVEDFLTLCVDFGDAGLDSTYDPWKSVDYFNRSRIYKKLSSSHKDIVEKEAAPWTPRVRSPDKTATELVNLRPSKRVRTQLCFGTVSKSEVARKVSKLRQGSSKS